MSEIELTETEAKAHAARQLIGHSLSYNPSDLFVHLDYPKPDQLANDVTRAMLTSATKHDVIDYRRNHGMDGSTFLRAGLRDTKDILVTTLKDYNDITQEQALAITQHPDTTTTLATLALRQESSLGSLINRRSHLNQSHSASDRSQYYDIDDEHTKLIVNNTLITPQEGGCPFAGDVAKVEPTPLFTRFVHWAGELSVRSIYYYK